MRSTEHRQISILVLAIAAMLVAAAAWAADPPAAASLAQVDEEKARQHYLAGETAAKSGDVLTAVVEWQTTLRLKPSSTYTAKVLAAATAKLGDDGRAAYAHYIKASDLADAGKLDDAGNELGLALAYRPKGQTPKCLTAKALELAELQKKAGKPVAAADTAVTTPVAAPLPTTAAAEPKKTATAAKSKLPTAKKNTSLAKTTVKKAEAKPAVASAPRVQRPKTYHQAKTYRAPVKKTPSRLIRVPAHTIDGRKIPAHYTIKPARPKKLQK